ncbi:MAG TPA: hypothetical protein VGC90_09880 [Candidatus Limnocylindrales bacterium]
MAYGTIAADSKANLRIGPDGKVSHRFRASTTSALVSVRFSQRGGPVYSGGTGGTVVISVHRDDGAGRPSSAVLASLTYSPGNPLNDGWTTFLDLDFPSPAILTEGHLYHIVFENVDAAPRSNFISINELAVLDGVSSPRQPTFRDADSGVLYTKSGAWILDGAYTQVMDLTYRNGARDGQGYIEAMVAKYGAIGGSAMVRERFVPRSTRTFSMAAVRVKRTTGGSPLTIEIVGPTGVIATGEVRATAVPIGSPLDAYSASAWARVSFPAVSLTAGTAYSLIVSSDSGTRYTATPVREGTDTGETGGAGHSTGFRSKRFTDGDGERSLDGGRTWAPLYPYSPVDLQFYLR